MTICSLSLFKAKQILRPQLGVMIVSMVVLSSVVALGFSYYKGWATFTYLLIALGIIKRKDRILHWRLMATAMLLDVFLVLILEFSRQAAQVAFTHRLNIWQISHVVASSLCVVLYIPTAFVGWRLLQKLNSLTSPWHRWLGYSVFILRTLSFILMFSMTGI